LSVWKINQVYILFKTSFPTIPSVAGNEYLIQVFTDANNDGVLDENTENYTNSTSSYFDALFTTLQVWPTVFDASTNVVFTIPEETQVTLKVFNSYGIPVKEFMTNELKIAGQHTETLEAYDLTNGVYFISLETCAVSKAKVGVKQ